MNAVHPHTASSTTLMNAVHPHTPSSPSSMPLVYYAQCPPAGLDYIPEMHEAMDYVTTVT